MGQAIAVQIQAQVESGEIAAAIATARTALFDAQGAALAANEAFKDADERMAETLPRVDHGEPLTLLLLDLDHVKNVNDRFGHGIGDEVLRRVGELLKRNCRSRDLAVRYGGEDFVLALASVRRDEAIDFAQRLRESVVAHPWRTVHPELLVSVSIGVAEASEAADASGLPTLADRRLSAAKYAGRNQVVHGRLSWLAAACMALCSAPC